MTDELKAAYERLGDAIQEVCQLQDYQGIPIEWVIVAAFQRFSDDGASITQVGTLLPDEGAHVPRHRTIGLLDYALTAYRAKVASDVT
jgi:hypothetical protein